MNLPDIFSFQDRNRGFLSAKGDFFKLERTSSDRIVATAKQGTDKFSKVIYTTGRVVETRSYNL